MADLPERLKRPYDPKETEGRIYSAWEDSEYFNPDRLPGERTESFSMVLPPPNVTGTLHTGHSLMLAIQDIMVRYARMQGKKALWLPGTDHAAIATESVVVKQLAREKKNKHDLGRNEFLARVNQFAQASHDTIVTQLKKMGASLDWTREAFTLDTKRHTAVFSAFKQMYDDGLIYRGYRVVNWDPKGQTTVSDDEVDHEQRKATLYYFKYDKDFPITIATTRPETKLGDTAVAVHPDDERYKEFIGKTFSVQFVGVPLSITVVADKDVDPEFGTGALGVTPSHSQIDWEMAERHGLEKIQIINEFGKMIVDHPDFKDKKVADARALVVEKLRDTGLIEKEEEIDQNISLSERTGAIIEPLPKLQWFIDVNKKTSRGKSLRELMIDAVSSRSVSILPERFEKIYMNWIENLRDWCISRQIWYGHRIPVWYRNPHLTVGDDEIQISMTSPGEGWTQDPDTLDTWFSSGLWTFSTLGWPEKTSDLDTFHPTTVLETGHDILFFWVARMILMSTYLLGEIPFQTVYLHGMVLDKQGKKMSKTRPETSVDPLTIIDKYGADALRMAMIVGNAPGSDIALSEDKIRAYSKFGNKLWNITRFVLENSSGSVTPTGDRSQVTEKNHQEYLDELDALVSEITNEMDAYRYYLVSEKLYHYVWHTFADKIIETVKPELKNGGDVKRSAEHVVRVILSTSLALLHPFMPFLTEELWGILHENSGELLLVSAWPTHR